MLAPCVTISIQAGSLNLWVCTMAPLSVVSAEEGGGPGNGAAPRPLQPGNKASQTTAGTLGMTPCVASRSERLSRNL